MGGAWTRAGTLIIARAHRALDEIHDRFRELNVNDPRHTSSHFAISHHPGAQWRSSGGGGLYIGVSSAGADRVSDRTRKEEEEISILAPR